MKATGRRPVVLHVAPYLAALRGIKPAVLKADRRGRTVLISLQLFARAAQKAAGGAVGASGARQHVAKQRARAVTMAAFVREPSPIRGAGQCAVEILSWGSLRGLSSAGRATGLQPVGHRFDPGRLHQPGAQAFARIAFRDGAVAEASAPGLTWSASGLCPKALWVGSSGGEPRTPDKREASRPVWRSQIGRPGGATKG